MTGSEVKKRTVLRERNAVQNIWTSVSQKVQGRNYIKRKLRIYINSFRIVRLTKRKRMTRREKLIKFPVG
jgi:hypothetical protein